MKYRTTGYDVTPPPPIKRKPIHKTGVDAPPGRIGVYVDGQRRAHVGPHAGVSAVSKLLGGASAEVGKVRGKQAWIASKSPSRSKELNRAQNVKLRGQLRQDKGSVR
jgi:hypothetical protein